MTMTMIVIKSVLQINRIMAVAKHSILATVLKEAYETTKLFRKMPIIM